jgi:hypothetical protein
VDELPTVFYELRLAVLPLYRANWRQYAAVGEMLRRGDHATAQSLAQALFDEYPRFARADPTAPGRARFSLWDFSYFFHTATLRGALQDWATRWNLAEDWVIEFVTDALWAWLGQDESLPDPERILGIMAPEAPPLNESLIAEGERRFTFTDEAGWDPLAETRVDVRRRLRAAMRSQIDAYLDNLSALAKSVFDNTHQA